MVTRRAEDDLLLLASDGLWDVLSNQVLLTPDVALLQYLCPAKLQQSMYTLRQASTSANAWTSAPAATIGSH